MKRVLVAILTAVLCSGTVWAACPPADLTGDCRVDLADFAAMAEQWMTEGTPTSILNGMTWVSIYDLGVDRDGDGDAEGFRGLISKYEVTNAQYCEFLNVALAAGQIIVRDNTVYAADDTSFSQPYFFTYNDGPYNFWSQITYSDEGTFSVRSRDGYSMANHPVVLVSWNGATAFCNYYGYRLPTEWEWLAVADYDGSYTYGCGTTMNFSMANYYDDYNDEYANPLGLTDAPYTSPVGYYPAYGYGMCDMAGNVWEWTSTSGDISDRITKGGSWSCIFTNSALSCRFGVFPLAPTHSLGFRPCR